MRCISIAACILLAGTSGALGQTQSPEPKLETLPAPTPLRSIPTESVGPPIVSGAVFPFEAPSSAAGTLSLDVDAVLWFTPNRRNSEMSATSNPVGVQSSGTNDTFGDEHLGKRMLPGIRASLGYWWTADDPWAPGGKLPLSGIEARFFYVSQISRTFDDESPTLTRPFFSLTGGGFSGLVIAAPGLATGGISTSASENMWGGEANYWCNLYYDWPGTTCCIEGMVGARYLNLHDNIDITSTSAFVAAPVGFPAYAFLAGNRINDHESFATRNQFFGGQVGIRGSIFFDSLVVSGYFQLAIGDTNEQINIQGSQTRIFPNGQTIQSPGALLALPGNIGNHYHNMFTEVPEVGVKFAYPINSYLTVSASFTVMYWSRIARPGDQIDTVIDVTQIPNFPGAAAAAPGGATRPRVPFNQSDVWLMGTMVCAEFKW